MRGLYTFLLLILFCHPSTAQQGFAFNHITTDDGLGLASNVVSSFYQDETGYLWVGTMNGLQRFDGSQFIQFTTNKPGSDNLPHANISQIVPAYNGKLILSLPSQREFGLFDPSTFIYKKIPLKLKGELHARAEFRLWKDSKGEVYLNILRYGIVHYNREQNAFVDDQPFPIPDEWNINALAVYEDITKQQYWFGCDRGLCIYDKRSRQMWTKDFNPKHLPILENEKVQDQVTQIYMDKQRRIWLFSWPAWALGGQAKLCFDSTGTRLLNNDTIGLNQGPSSYAEYNYLYETHDGDLWVYGANCLFNYDKYTRRFYYNKKGSGKDNVSIDYDIIYQVYEDRDEGIWFATDRGIYYTSVGSGSFSVANILFNDKNESTSITDILGMPNGEVWLSCWGCGIKSIDKSFNKTPNYVYRQPPPSSWSAAEKSAATLTWSLCRQQSTGNVWVGCQSGVVLVHNPARKTTEYFHPEEANNSSIRYITEDGKGQLWFGTQGGRLIKWSDNKFTVVLEIGTIIYKIFIDSDGWLWLATHEKGVYAVDPNTGAILQHYINDGNKTVLYSNTGNDLEQLKKDVIVFAGGAVHFINKKTGKVDQLKYEDGLPSNSAVRLRMDKSGYLWIITSNGLCRYNPNNNRITAYGRKDGIVLAEQANVADYVTEDENLVFGGGNALVMFNPSLFLNTKPPPPVTITDFRLFNQPLSVDSLMQNRQVKLKYDQNAISIYFASLSFMQRDKLTYYYKLEGIDKDWIKADRSYYANYSLLPPGKYSFKVYCETLEGMRSPVTQFKIELKPPFYKTLWFTSLLFFIIALLIYAAHNVRVNRLMAIEALRNRVARDLHDDMGSTLSTINILSTMAINKMDVDKVKTSDYLKKISEYSQRMMEVMDDIVWSIKPSNDSMLKITARMREFATEVLEAKDIDFEFKVEEELQDVKLNMEARRDFFLVFKEAVNNAAKYSEASKVDMEICMRNKKLIMVVKDDGQGFNVQEADGNGLGNMQKRADNLNGELTIESKQGNGTKVKLSVPML